MSDSFYTRCGDGVYSLTFETDSRANYLYMQQAARKCVHHDHKNDPERTNYYRIVSMSPDELARFLYTELGCESIIPFCQNKPQCDQDLEQDKLIPEERCISCLEDWLLRFATEEPDEKST